MKPSWLLFRLLSCWGVLLMAVAADDKAQAPRVLAHYMPWYATKDFRGEWGWHWTMNQFDPDTLDAEGARKAATHDPPLIGLYDSGDPAVLECQVLQMKLAGIDGVIIDWYGTRDFYDYAMVHGNTRALVPFLEKAGLSFAICYEDQSIGKMVEGGSLDAGDAASHARDVLGWVEKNWFSRDSYLRHRSRPVLITFGPQYFRPEAWEGIVQGLTSDPWLFALPHLSREFGADGPFGWPPVHGGNRVEPEQWREALNRLYQRSKKGEAVMGIAFPGYEDIYEEAGLHESYGHIDHRDGNTLKETLDLALENRSPLIQIATWNDYGEGTMIEPTKSRGYQYLEEIQSRFGSRFSPQDLRLPSRLLALRRTATEKSAPSLDAIAEFLFQGETRQAEQALTAIEKGD